MKGRGGPFPENKSIVDFGLWGASHENGFLFESRTNPGFGLGFGPGFGPGFGLGFGMCGRPRTYYRTLCVINSMIETIRCWARREGRYRYLEQGGDSILEPQHLWAMSRSSEEKASWAVRRSSEDSILGQ